MANHEFAPIFAALSDQTRFAVVERLCRGAASVSELQKPFDMATPTFLRHLQVLEKAGVVRTRKQGRVRMVALRRETLGRLEAWVAERRREAEARLDRLEAFLDDKEV